MAGMKDSMMHFLDENRKKNKFKNIGISFSKRSQVKIQAEEEIEQGGSITKDIRQPVDLKELVASSGKDDEWGIKKSRNRTAQYGKEVVIEKGEVDPLGTGATLMPELIKVSGPRMLVVKSKKKLNSIKIMDIETWGLDPSILHFGYVFDPTNQKPFLFRSMNAPVVQHREFYKRDSKKAGSKKGDLKSVSYYIDYTRPGFIDYVNFDITSREKDAGYFQRIYAHNMQGFEGVAIALAATSTRDYDPSYQNSSYVIDEDGKDRFTWHQKANKHPDVEPFLRKGLWEDSGKGCTPLIIKVPVFDDTGHIIRYEDVSWNIRSAGDKHYIQIKYGKNITEIVDSMWHLPGPLKNYGAKGLTPLKNTNPIKWLKQEIKEDRLIVSEGVSGDELDQILYDYWFNDLTEEDMEYCLQDCKILAEALNDYRITFGEYFKDPVTNEPVDPLESLTLAASALAGMIIMSPQSLRKGTINDRGFPKSMIGWDAGMLGGKPSFHLLDTPNKQATFFSELGHIANVQSTGYVNKDFPSLIENPIFLDAGIAAMYKWVQFGGRTEIYQPRNAKNTRIIVLDINNSFGAAMSGTHNGENLRVADPTEIKEMRKDIKGREAILEHLDSYSGMYLIRSKPPKLQSLRTKYPIFGLRMAGTEYDERLCFPDWDGRIYLYVTGEELRYMLQLSSIEDDDITALKVGSYVGPLVDMTKMPFASFVQMIYKDRKQDSLEIDKIMVEIEAMELRQEDSSELRIKVSQLESNRQIRKNLFNTSYGKMVENYRSTEIMTAIPAFRFRNEVVIEKMKAMTPEWLGWQELDKIKDFGTEEALNLAMRWGNDHYMQPYNRNLHRDGKDIMRIKISLPGELAQYAIRSLGSAITAFGRIFLHKGLMAVDRVLLEKSDTQYDITDFSVCYDDTDSMHVGVPEDMTDENAIKKLSEPTFLVNGKEQPIIKIGDGLGEWKIEKVKITPWLLDDKIKAHLEKEGLGVHNIDAFYLAPKHYYLCTKPDSEGYRHVLQEVIKGIPSNHTAMRVAMYGFNVSSSKLGDPNGMRAEKPEKIDLMIGLENTQAHRRSYDNVDRLSDPVVIRAPLGTDLDVKGAIRNPKGGVEGRKIAYIDYMAAVQEKTFEGTNDAGLKEALHEYVRGCKARGVVVRDLRMLIRKAHQMLKARIQNGIDSNQRLHYNFVMEWVENSFISKPFEINKDGSISIVDEAKDNSDGSIKKDKKATENSLGKPSVMHSDKSLEGKDLWDDMFDENEV